MRYSLFPVLVAILFSSTFVASAAEARRNVLFILTEDQGPQMGALETAGLLTPRMDELAAAGTLFRRAYVAYPVCSASKAAIYTSLHNHTNGLLNNTANYHKPASRLTDAERNREVYRLNYIHGATQTLVERLKNAGYYQGVTHKLHVAPVERFPYDEFVVHSDGKSAADFFRRAKSTGKPWHLFFNIAVSHRPFPNSDKVKIRVNPAEVKLPAFLPDTPTLRKDWSEYLAAIEEADRYVGEALTALHESGMEENTVVVLMGDHGPCYAHGKMSLYDLGLRVPLVIRAPGLKSGVVSDSPVSELDLMPTLLELLGLKPAVKTHGVSLTSILNGNEDARPRAYAFAEISDRGPLPNDGMQERCVTDGRWSMIYREKTETNWRQVQADNKFWKPWGNRAYDETLRVKDQFPEAFRILAEMDPQNLGAKVPTLELYDMESDPDQMHNLANDAAHSSARDRLYAALLKWVRGTEDSSVKPPDTPPN